MLKGLCMVGPTEICNEALGELGASLIQGFTDGTSVSTLCGTFYPQARDATLELHVWDFAQRRVLLAASAEAPAFGWAYQFPLPTDPYCLKVHETDRGSWVPWDVELDSQGRRVLLSDQSSVGILYTARIEDLNLWSPLALQVLVKVLAAKLAKPITGQNSTAEMKLKEAYTLLPQAKASDGQQGTPRVLRLPQSVAYARHGSGRSGVWPYYHPRTYGEPY
jgi:hypothetical protein